MQHAKQGKVKLKQSGAIFIGSFAAMASPCEILIETTDKKLALNLTKMAAKEAWRIEQKYSRYNQQGMVWSINNSQGQELELDTETARLMDFAFQCYDLSEGLFDISSGVLRQAWQFNGGSQLATQAQIEPLLAYVGLNKVHWQNNILCLSKGMEIDFGGIGKEYAVDRVLQLLRQQANLPILVNFGGDIAASRRTNKRPWNIGIEALDKANTASELLHFYSGGVATSGDSQRFILNQGVRYSHILNPKTGWPISDAPHSVTVIAPSCTEAGISSTFAMLHGKQAEQFLANEEIQYHVQR